MDKPNNNLEDYSEQDLIALCAKTVEQHESSKNKIAKLTLDTENEIKILNELEEFYVELINQLNNKKNVQ